MKKPTIMDLLHGNGNIIGAAQRASRSLSSAERRRLDRVRSMALRMPMYWSTINAFEMAGERGERGVMAPPIDIVFRGLNSAGVFGISTRLYNIEGDHPQNGSTVDVSNLVRNGMLPNDLNIFAIAREVIKEHFVLAVWWTLSAWQVLKIRVGGN